MVGVLSLCNGVLSTGPSGEPLCSVPWAAADVVTLQQLPFDISQLDPQALFGAFGAGFILIGSIWVVAHVAAIIVNFINS